MLRSKRGIVGLVIIVVAIVVALTAPLLTPYDPIWSTNLSGKLVPPSWQRYLPGGAGLSQNMIAVDEASLLSTADPIKQFNITVTPSNLTQDVIVQYSAFGATGSSGSLAITFQTVGLPINSSITVQIMRDFYYPYSGIPGAIVPSGTVLASRMEGIAVSPTLILEQKWLTFTPHGVASYKTTQFEFGVNFLDPFVPGQAEYTESDFAGPNPTAAALGWQSPLLLPSYQASQNATPLEQLFPRTGTYSYGISVTATKQTANAQGIVYVDDVNLKLEGTSWGLLGTDEQGRDVFTELVYGTQVSLYVGLVAAFFSTMLGLIVGLVAAYSGGIVDEVLMRFTDALLVLPTLPLMIVLIMALTGGAYNINILILVFGALGWQGFARVVRSQVLSLKERPYVEAAKAVGAGTPYILWRHILPNVIVLIYVTLALTVPAAIVTEAAFSFLGFVDFSHMSWGRMLTALQLTPSIWWIVVPPGLAIMILSLSFILIGYAIDDILNPKLRARR
jgi:peptide/nickel transport system permease protein